MAVGRYYLNKGDYIGAINRFRTVVEQYQRTSQIAEALERLTEAYYARGVYNEAKTRPPRCSATIIPAAHGTRTPTSFCRVIICVRRLTRARGCPEFWARISKGKAMLAALTVRDIVLIESAALEFAAGLNVLTGETGAGKSILLDALGLAAGGRGRASVRPGATQGSATAVFEPSKANPAHALLAAQSILVEGEIVLRRTLSADGRTRAFVNDEPVGVALLRDVGSALLEVHGQADDRGLFDVSTHRGMLDAFAGHDALLRETAEKFSAFDRAPHRSFSLAGRSGGRRGCRLRASCGQGTRCTQSRGGRRSAAVSRACAIDERVAHRRRCVGGGRAVER